MLFVLVGAASAGPCIQQDGMVTSVQWSVGTTIPAPNLSAYVELKPNLAGDENESMLELHDCASDRRAPLFVITRSADIRWSQDSRTLLAIDHPTADTYEVILFTVGNHRSGLSVQRDSKFNDLLRRKVGERINLGRPIVFFRPAFKTWDGPTLTLAIVGTSADLSGGAMHAYCFKAIVNTNDHRILRIVRWPNGCKSDD